MNRIVVSCTTASHRIAGLYYMLESLRWQTLVPDAVVLNISSEPHLYDEGIRTVPDWMSRFDVAVQWVPNTGPYRKLLPTLDCVEPDDIVVTVDDDVIVGADWLESLVTHALENKDSIVAARARAMTRTILGGWRNYSEWSLVRRCSKSAEIVPIGCSGTVYRKRLLDINFITDPAYLGLAPTADDLWLKMGSYIRGVPVVVDPRIDTRSMHLVQGVGLKTVNLEQGAGIAGKIRRNTLGAAKGKLGLNESENDRSWDRICAYARSRMSWANGDPRNAR